MKSTFKNHTEASFCDYLLSRGYAQSTALHYIVRLRRIKSLDQLVQDNLSPYISDYETGTHKMENARAHKAISSALKRLQAYQNHKGIIV